MDQDRDWLRQRGEFLASQTPRRIPPEIAKSVLTRNRALTFVGLFVLALGSIVSWAFFPTDILKQWKLDHDPSAIVTGTITDVEPTNLTVNKVKVMKNHFHFHPENQPEREGDSHTTGRRWTPGSTVQVRYVLADPGIAAPVGARIGQNTGAMIVILIVPLIGLGLLAGRSISIRRKKHLLQNGLLATATVASVEPTSVRINNQPQFKITLVRKDNGSRISRRTHHSRELELLSHRMQNAEPVQILHDRHKPKRLLLPETWER